MKPLVLAALSISLISSDAFGQSTTPKVVNATGGTYQKGYYVLDWSIGELALVNQMKAPNAPFIITNGFLQPFSHNLNAPRPENLFTEDEIKILPNPTHGIVEINFLTKQEGKVKVKVHDRMGKVIIYKEFTSSVYGRFERIDLTGYINGTYVIHIELNPDPGFIPKKGSYKIVKIGR